ncbi:hypothetical protein [Aurantimonas sp. VKM B-3413]|uniref:hypothetical protein n=1 Tax=Aurantimonas sp. VKM B-3413 TaxID=2779401 RepID=UPI001E34A2FE|nr:hypothetical protein [Aurantimonas sp. VKM B-3413]MCB8840200.1 hypothetical protein [Aurantimonas sp. VKM B-3413]
MSDEMDVMRKRVEAADRTRRWRETHEHRPDTRRCDRVIVEALVEYLRTTPGSEHLMKRILDDATSGLVFQGFPTGDARREVARRLRYLTAGPGVGSGSVRAARKRGVSA